MPRPTISGQYDYDSRHWSFTRNTNLPRHTFRKPFEQMAGEWAAVAFCAVALAIAIVAFTY